MFMGVVLFERLHGRTSGTVMYIACPKTVHFCRVWKSKLLLRFAAGASDKNYNLKIKLSGLNDSALQGRLEKTLFYFVVSENVTPG